MPSEALTGYVVTYDEVRHTWRVYSMLDGMIMREYGASFVAQNRKRDYADAMQILRRLQAGHYGQGNWRTLDVVRYSHYAPTNPRRWRGRGGQPLPPRRNGKDKE